MIDWNKFVQVAIAAVGFTTVIVAVFSLGLRLLTNAQLVAGAAKKGDAKAARVEFFNRIAAYSLFAVSSLALIFGLLLILEKNAIVLPFLPHLLPAK